MLHGVGEDVGVAQEPKGALHISLGDEGADVGGGDGDPIDLHLGHHVAADPQLSAEFPELLGIPLPFIAKMEVVAHHQVDRPMVPNQIIGDKLPPGSFHHAAVVVGHNDLPDAVKPLHEPRPVGGGSEQRHRLLAGDQGGGVEVEGKGGGNGAQLGGALGTEG
jgi:hypothetical protein